MGLTGSMASYLEKLYGKERLAWVNPAKSMERARVVWAINSGALCQCKGWRGCGVGAARLARTRRAPGRVQRHAVARASCPTPPRPGWARSACSAASAVSCACDHARPCVSTPSGSVADSPCTT